jgi:hypothetical protein
MSTPGFQNQQALHRATQAAEQSRLIARRRAARKGRAPAHGGLRMVGRVIRAIVSLLIIGFAIGVFVLIVKVVDPGWFGQISSWISSLF